MNDTAQKIPFAPLDELLDCVGYLRGLLLGITDVVMETDHQDMLHSGSNARTLM